MYSLLFILCLCNFAIGAAIPEDKDAKIISYDYKNYGGGKYEFSYVTSNGIERNETAHLVNAGQHNQHVVVHGFYSYIDPDGESRLYQYTADENGYHVHFQESINLRAGEGNEDYPRSYAVKSIAPQVASLLG